MKSLPNTIYHRAQRFELISGPWLETESRLMDACLHALEAGHIPYQVRKGSDGHYVYRSAVGYKNERVNDVYEGDRMAGRVGSKLMEFIKNPINMNMIKV